MSRVFSTFSSGRAGPTLRSPLVWDGGYLKDPDTALLFKLNEGTGTLIHDASSFDNFGTITGAEWTDGKYGQGDLKVSAVGTDFVELTRQDDWKQYIPIGQVVLRVTPAK